MLTSILNAFLLVLTVPGAFVLGAVTLRLVRGSIEDLSIWLIIGLAGSVHGLLMASIEHMIRSPAAPAHLYRWSGITVGFAACALFELMIDPGIPGSVAILAGLGAVAVLPHMALIPAVDLDATRQ